MKALIPILIGLLVVGCGEKQSTNTNEGNNTPVTPPKQKVENKTPSNDNNATKLSPEEQKVVGEYEFKHEDGDIGRTVFLENGVWQGFSNDKKDGEGKWNVVDGEIHVTTRHKEMVLRINKDGSITFIAYISKDGKRKEAPKEKQTTFKKIESEKETPSNGDYKNSTTAKSSRKLTAEEAKLVGIYEGRYRIALRKDMVFGLFHMDDGEKEGEGTWIVENREVKAADASGNNIWFLRIEANNSLTFVARMDENGKRKDHPKEEQDTYKKIK